VRERERARARDRERETERERQTDRQTDSETERDRERAGARVSVRACDLSLASQRSWCSVASNRSLANHRSASTPTDSECFQPSKSRDCRSSISSSLRPLRVLLSNPSPPLRFFVPKYADKVSHKFQGQDNEAQDEVSRMPIVPFVYCRVSLLEQVCLLREAFLSSEGPKTKLAALSKSLGQNPHVASV